MFFVRHEKDYTLHSHVHANKWRVFGCRSLPVRQAHGDSAHQAIVADLRVEDPAGSVSPADLGLVGEQAHVPDLQVAVVLGVLVSLVGQQ